MALVDSLLTAIVRADGDALVMHVGEHPYVIASAGPIALSAHALNLGAMEGMLGQLLPSETCRVLQEFGAVEYELPAVAATGGDRFTVVAARGGDDIWIEFRRHRRMKAGSGIQRASAPAAPAVCAAEPTAHAPIAAAQPVPAAAETPVIAAVAEPAVVPTADIPGPVRTPEAAPAAAMAHPPAAAVGARNDDVVAAPRMEQAPPREQALPRARVVSVEYLLSEMEGGSEADRLDDTVPAVNAHPETPAPLEPADVVAREDSSGPAEVIPLRAVRRPEVGPLASPTPRGLERLLRLAASRGATALYLTSQSPPAIRVDGEMQRLPGEALLTSGDVEAAVLEILPEGAAEKVSRGETTEWLCVLADTRLRCTTFRDHQGPGVLLRMISGRAVSAEQLGLSREIQALATEPEGLILVSGPRGSGKSTLVAAMVDLVNRQRADYVITLQREIRLIHEHRRALISQREVHGHGDEVVAAARAALRENPDVLVIEDLRSPDVLQVALDAAGSGLLVVVSVTANATAAALERLVDMAPVERRGQIQTLLAETLRGAVSQVLLRKAGGGRLAAGELLLGTSAVAGLIAEGQLAQLPRALDSGRKHGMVPLNDALVACVQSGAVEVREAYRKACDRAGFLAQLKREGVDTSFVERLA
jgi:twitching motility protein PilT